MPTDSPLISVVIPIYNAEPYLKQCLDSILSQTYDNLEILCLNDGSTDSSSAIVQQYSKHEPRIRAINKPNEGYGATCNRGLAEARGTWISIVEPDDWIEREMYSDMLAFESTFEEPLDIIKTPYWRIWMADTPKQRKLNCSYRGRVITDSQPFAIQDTAHLLSHHPSIWSAVYRKSFLDAKEIRFREYPGAGWADNPFLISTLCQTKKIGYFDMPYYCYREETPEKSALFARTYPLLPFERWNDMMDELERLGIHNEAIMRAHNSRGFTYLSGILEEVGFSRDDVKRAAEYMFNRMEANLVLSDPEISPGNKRIFIKLRQLPETNINPTPYIQSLIKQGCYNLKNTGLTATWYAMKRYFKRRVCTKTNNRST